MNSEVHVGLCRRRLAARSWQLGLQLDLEWTWKALANASRAAAGPPHWSLKPAGRPTAQHPDCQIPMMRSTSHEIGSSGKGVRDQFEQKSHRLGIILRTRHSHQVSKTALDGPSASRACSSSPQQGAGQWPLESPSRPRFNLFRRGTACESEAPGRWVLLENYPQKSTVMYVAPEYPLHDGMGHLRQVE